MRWPLRFPLIALLLVGVSLAGLATLSGPVRAEPPPVFEDQALADRYHDLINELRCVVCQNQNIAESNAELAQDLRRETRRMLLEGSSDAEIMEFMVARYGDFVLYRPPLRARTWVLWFAPFLFLAGGAVVVWLVARSRRREPEEPISPEDQARLDALVAERRVGQ